MALELSFSEHGSGRPVVILHGLFGSKRNWQSIAKRLAANHHVILADLRNHGDSPWHDAMRYQDMAEDIAALLKRRGLGPTAVVGHSMGGKASMVLALIEPRLVERLCVVDISPAPSGGTLIDYIQDMRSLDLSKFERRSQVEEALEQTITEPAIRSFLAHNVKVGPSGLSWQVNLATLEAAFDDIMGFPDLHPKHYLGKTLFLAGGRSDYIQPHHHAVIESLFPKADIDVIPNAGHWVHAEQPARFIEKISGFLN